MSDDGGNDSVAIKNDEASGQQNTTPPNPLEMVAQALLQLMMSNDQSARGGITAQERQPGKEEWNLIKTLCPSSK